MDNVRFTLELCNRFVVVGTVDGVVHVFSCFKDGRKTKVRTWKKASRGYGKKETVFMIKDDRMATSLKSSKNEDEAFINHAIDEKKTGDYKKSRDFGYCSTYVAENETMHGSREFRNVVRVKNAS